MGVENGPATGDLGSAPGDATDLGGGPDSLKRIKSWFVLRKPTADACGCSGLLQRGGNDLLRQQSTRSKTSKQVEITWRGDFTANPSLRRKVLLCGVNLSEVGFAAGQRASPELPEPWRLA